MARPFRPTRKGYAAELEYAEAQLLAMLAHDIDQMLAAREAEHIDAGLKPASDAQDPAGASNGTSDSGGTHAGVAGAWWEELGLSNDIADPDSSLLGEAHTLADPEDPALLAILPRSIHSTDAVGALDGADDAMRARTEPGLVSSKREGLQWLARAVMKDPFLIPPEKAGQAASTLNVMRLVLAARLGIENQEDADRVQDAMEHGVTHDPDQGMAVLYGFTSWLQDSLMHALLRGKA
ncbi:DUF2017 family protein [Pseudoglutamicibacter albus]|uniref:DUF2017 family protein n=1 Tax=Pseudoglutamicibacter albus TaxID=98671 RepID=UPI000C756F1D|nr:DUF2017 family protein [Pseudoglutamicibacter albus]PKY81104.1 hypothetical protein CYJ35_01410 [Pseudoglutamicibacter albus]WIK84244.1 DUF2017 family protein [Pseudoglutamicibacter albus]